MHYRYLLASVAVLSWGTALLAIDPSDLKPGLIARFAEAENGPAAASVVRLEPTVALALNLGESPHPRLVRNGFATWSGYINVVRPGRYTFSALLQGGTLAVSVGGKSVYTATSDKEPAATSSEATLDGGVQPFSATFHQVASAARVELFWQGPGFVKEPLPHQFLGHMPKDRPQEFAANVELERGRFRFEELACIRCHKPDAADKMAKGLIERSGPNLTEIGKRAYAGWIDAWLADPAKLRPQTAMPALFASDEQGRAERFAVTQYLLSLSNAPLVPAKTPIIASNEVRQSAERGRVLYSVSGCAACHQEIKAKPKDEEDDREPLKPDDYFASLGTAGPAAKYTLGAVGSKTKPEPLATYLQNPLKSNPHGRMPQMNLNGQESTDLARYLCRSTDESLALEMPATPKSAPLEVGRKYYANVKGAKPADELAGIDKLAPDKQWLEIGRKLTVSKGCANCHVIEQNGKALPAIETFPKLATIAIEGAKGCIASKRDPGQVVPAYKLEARESAAIAAFLQKGLKGAGSPAPAYSARVALRRFNCLNCHSRDGEGGFSTELADQMRQLEKAENADDVRPPLLTGIGHKSRTSWLRSVLVGGGRARPWMQLRMPQYGEGNVAFLPEALASLEGTAADDTVFKLPLTTAKIQLGKQIVGKSGLGCISCHDIGGVANTGTRGPDLSTIDQRVRYEWYGRWLHQPLRMAPGTRMPQAFVEGKSTLSTVANGDPKAQAEAMWAYLSLGPGLPLPEGLEPPKGLIVSAKDRPEVLRTFMPDAGSKGIAIGYPGGINLAFSADQCRLAYAWGGNFLDASPVWANRGGAPAKLLGPKFWQAPIGHPWGLTTNPNIPPDFLARANSPAFGMPLPLEPPRVYEGPRAVNFDGYSLDQDGRPTFRYTLRENDKDGTLQVAEGIAPVKAAVATGFVRQFSVEAPSGYSAWFLAGQSVKDPRAVAIAGTGAVNLDLKSQEPQIASAGLRLVLPQEGDKAIVVEALGAPEGTVWRFASKPGGWLVMLRLPEAKAHLKCTFGVATWALPKDDEAFLNELTVK